MSRVRVTSPRQETLTAPSSVVNIPHQPGPNIPHIHGNAQPTAQRLNSKFKQLSKTFARGFSMDRYSSITGLCAPALECVRDEVPEYRPKTFKQKHVVLRTSPFSMHRTINTSCSTVFERVYAVYHYLQPKTHKEYSTTALQY
jgi:hypothetical protein